ncbi:haloacid dehalogenase-like hydrolase [Cognatilysobacter bugurensis]|uniref:Hydrolase n=1 Tax=Cognatilysobacter bugurensis TaxID=543356 RepID=A0A918W646_9GAMM|nr:haloacid dehalogenase-like hydrolase [Lysobacter bugurensis]GHA69102.1 hydrolase [Lysobacter bugurensis]
MPHATNVLHDRIAVVFDFDLTLGEGSIDVLLRTLDVDPDEFRSEWVDPLDAAGWDHALARFKALVDLSERLDGAVTREKLEQVGRDTPLYPEVERMFDRIRNTAQAVAEGLEVEFYVLTAGFVEVPCGTPIAHEFKAIWGSAGHYADDGRLVFPRRVVTYPEKVRYLLQLAKGLSVDGADAPADVYRDVPQERWHVPFDQMVYVGDGASDLPAFDLVESRGGIAIGVFGPGESASGWSKGHDVHRGRRVHNLACADYREDAELMRSLCLAVESIAKLVALRRLGCGE